MTAIIKQFTGQTTLDLDVDMVLENTKGLLDEVMIIGITKEGALWVGSNYSDVQRNIYRMVQAQRLIMDMTEQDNDRD